MEENAIRLVRFQVFKTCFAPAARLRRGNRIGMSKLPKEAGCRRLAKVVCCCLKGLVKMKTRRRGSLSLPGTFALALVLASCGGRVDTQKLMSEARQYRDKGEFNAAIIQVKNVLQKSPDDRNARTLLARIYLESGDPASAEKEIRRALELGADRSELLALLGKSLVAQQKYQAVIDEVTPPAQAAVDPGLLAVRGDAYLALGSYENARSCYSSALAAAPKLVEAVIGLGKLSLMDGDKASAMRLAEQATADGPASGDAWLFLGDVMRAGGSPAKAQAAYEKAVEAAPRNPAGYIAAAMLDIGSDNFEAAGKRLDAARKRAPQSLLVVYSQAFLDFRRGRYKEAKESIQQVLKAAPDHMPSILLAGAVEYQLGAAQAAQDHLKRFLEKYPGDRYAGQLLTAAYLKSGDTALALKTVQPLLESGDKDMRLLALAGDAYMKARDFSKATQLFEQAAAASPKTANVHAALGASRLAQGDSAGGIAELETATKLDPTSGQTNLLLILTHLRLHQFDQAISRIAGLEKADPQNPVLPNLEGAAYLGKGERDGARAAFGKAASMQQSYFAPVANLAQMDIQDGKSAAAKTRLEAFLRGNGKNVEAMTALAGIAVSERNLPEATAWLEKANAVDPANPDAAAVLASHYVRIGEPRKALNTAQKLQVLNPDKPKVLDILGQAQLAAGDPASAVQTYKRLLALDQQSAFSHYRLAGAQAAAGNMQDAASALNTALRLQPDYLDAQKALIALETQRGNLDRAVAVARQVQGQSGNRQIGLQLEGNVLMLQGKPQAAAGLYEKAFAEQPSGSVALAMYRAYTATGQEQSADKALLKWIKTHPLDAAARLALADGYLARQKAQDAIPQYQAILTNHPKNPAALNNLALAYAMTKDPQALSVAEKALEVSPKHPAVLDTVGWLLVEKGEIAKGVALLQQAASSAPKVPDIRFHLAQGLIKAGDKTRAKAELQELIASNPAYSRAADAKAMLRSLE
ncbi:MAG: XrtA/PEP-CTERM system TPR-repeat protein PrsT [Burkholderiaceae bacterium]